ncbi:hypothetical protein JCM8547_008456 [Rhodosporidiobolus lusitaniae]
MASQAYQAAAYPTSAVPAVPGGGAAQSADTPAVMLVDGVWNPLRRLASGYASSAFLPLTRDVENAGGTVDREQLNPHQVPLELGDEVYCCEVFRPSQPVASSSSSFVEDVWYRGYIVSSNPRPRLQTATDIYSFPSSSSFPTLSDEPQVSLGIFPAAAVTIREHLEEDAERKLSSLAAQVDAQSAPLARAPSRGPSRAASGRMEPLHEEDEDEDDTYNIDGSTRWHGGPVDIAPNASPSKSKNRASVGSMASFAQQLSTEQKASFQSSRLSQQFGGAGQQEDVRPPPPLPNLKAGDETLAGADESLIDEIACALREWASLLYTHLYRRDYKLFETVKGHFDALHGARKQMLARTLSLDETDKLRRDAVARLAKCNLEQGLDIIVRHPVSGALLDVNVEGELERNAWMSVVRMYAMQVALAYGAPLPDSGLPRNPPPVHTPNPNLSPALQSSPDPSQPSSSANVKFHHILLDVRAIVANIAAPGEFVELYFSLFNKSEARYVSEDYCLVLNSNGAPAKEAEGRFGDMRTLFRDLSQHDVTDQLYLVCRTIKNGAIKSSGSISYSTSMSSPNGSRAFLGAGASVRSDTASFDSSLSPSLSTNTEKAGSAGMLFTDGMGRESYRRPFGCAVLELSQFNKRPTADDDSGYHHDSLDGLEEHQMPIFVPVSESAFSTLHEDIINSRIKEFEKSPRAEHLAVSVKVLYGEANELVRDLHLDDVPFTSRLGFPDVVFPGDERNEVYLKLWSGEFASLGGSGGTGTVRSLAQLAAAGGAGNVEVTAELRRRDGTVVERVLSRGAGESKVSHYSSMVFKSNNTPTWGELIKLAVPAETMNECHLFLSYSNRNQRGSSDVPFAFSYFPLCTDDSTFQTDGSHSLVLYRYSAEIAIPSFYFQAPSTFDASRQLAPLPPSISRTLVPLANSVVVVRSFLVSTTYTQNETLTRLLNWEKQLVGQPELMEETLTKLKFCPEVEVCKFLRDIFDALFGILVSSANASGELNNAVFQAIVTLFSIVADRRFANFSPVLELYISQHFTGSTAAMHMVVRSLANLLRKPTDPANATTLRSSLKVWKWLFKLVVRSREIQRTKGLGASTTSDHLAASFKSEIQALLGQVNSLMRVSTPPSIIGTHTLVVQNFASILPELSSIFDQDELTDIAIAFVDSIGNVKGKLVVYKILLLNQLVKSHLFASPTGRATLVPSIVRWLKPSLGRFEEHIMCSPTDAQTTRDQARVGWIEALRLSVGVVAAVLDTVQVALVDPELGANRALVAQEEDNIECLLGLLPRLVDAYREMENLGNLDAIERQRTPASIPSTTPVVFPSSYPISLLSYPAPRGSSSSNGDEKGWPTLRAGVGEIACVFLALLHLAPRKILVNYLESTVEVEGRETFSRQLGQIFRVARSILDEEAFPSNWLNITVLAHRVVLRLAEPVAEILVRDFIPPSTASFKFATPLWRDFFGMLLKLLASPSLTIEEFSPQKRRAAWRLAGDVRGEGAKILDRTWNAIAAPEDRKPVKFGLYQVQFVPGLVPETLSLCLSHHDELRLVAVRMLYSMIVSEYALNRHFGIIEAQVVGGLDTLFGSQSRGDEVSRAFFIAQLRQLFDESDIDDQLREQADAFLESINSFLDLLLAVRNLPDGEEYQEDRIISTLRLMTFIRGIGRSEIFIRYVQRLVTYHSALGNETEAGLTLKLHADLHEWDLTNFVDALPDLDLPRQTEFARKETLYMRILEHLGKGKAWETAIDLTKELQHEYENKSFNYSRLSELLHLQAELYGSIAKSDRHFGNYFRVAFYGNRWPTSVSGKQFIYRGQQDHETLGSFMEKMLNKHPSAQLLKTSSIPSEEVQYGEGQFLQITAVLPEIDRSLPLFTNPDVPHYVRTYYQHNDINTFSFTRPLPKDVAEASGRSSSTGDPASLWTEKTVLICEDSFPTVLRRSEVVEIRLIEISPVENALKDVETKRAELANLERRFRALSQTEPDLRKINSNPLSMALNGAVDAPMNQGIPKYREAFLKPEFIASLPPSQVGIVRQLESAVDELVITLARCLKLHGQICPPEMIPFHETLERFYERNFADELARLPDQAYSPTTFGFNDRGISTSASSTTVSANGHGHSHQPSESLAITATSPSLPTGPRAYGSLLITSSGSMTSLPPPSASSASLGLPIHGGGRRESVSSHAINDASLVAGPSRAARQASGMVGSFPSSSSLNNGGRDRERDGRSSSVYPTSNGHGRSSSPTRSLFSIRSAATTTLGPAGTGGAAGYPSAPNGGSETGSLHSTINGGGGAGGVGRRASLFLSAAAGGVGKGLKKGFGGGGGGGRRKGSVGQGVQGVPEE